MLSDAQQIMVEENLGLVRAVLSRCVNNPGSMGIYSYNDLFQIGCIGLCKAAAQYQPGRAVFSTYAYIAIRNHIYNALAYATYRQEKEVLSEFLYEPPAIAPTDAWEAGELGERLRKAQSKLKGVTRKGIDAMIFMSQGFTCKEIGEMYGDKRKLRQRVGIKSAQGAQAGCRVHARYFGAHHMKRSIRRMAIPIVSCILTLTWFRVFFFVGYVPSSSMEPTIPSKSFILANRTAYWFSEPQVGDIIVFRRHGKTFVKRVGAVEGAVVQTLNGLKTVPKGMLYLLGDNAEASIDSRHWREPFIPAERVIARYYEW